VVLTGTLGDGASGLRTLSLCGGMTVVQHPHDAAFPEMPLTALNRARPDHVVRLTNMPELLEKPGASAGGEPKTAPAAIKYEVEIT
jgi:two-component system, chemotaxis family, protein-glutamate methylesterase/glutaminase